MMILWFSWHKIWHVSVAPLRECHKYFMKRYNSSLLGWSLLSTCTFLRLNIPKKKLRPESVFICFPPVTAQVLRIRFCEVAQSSVYTLLKYYVLPCRSCGLTASLAFTLIFGPCSNQLVSLYRKKPLTYRKKSRNGSLVSQLRQCEGHDGPALPAAGGCAGVGAVPRERSCELALSACETSPLEMNKCHSSVRSTPRAFQHSSLSSMHAPN